MEGFRKSSRATYRCGYHLVRISKHRYEVLVREMKGQLKEIQTDNQAAFRFPLLMCYHRRS